MSDKAPTFNLTSEFGEDGLDAVSTAPYWVICVFPLGLPLSFSRSSMSSSSKFPADGAKLRGPRLIITGDCRQLTITNSKASHLKSLQASLTQSSINYLVEILPGDWIMAWMVNYEETAIGSQGIVGRLRSGEPCNHFDDGLKFIGRVESIDKNLRRMPDGNLSASYSLSASAFKELDTSIFYDHNLAEFASSQVGTWLAKIGLNVRELFKVTKNGNVQDNVHILIPSFFEILLGSGVAPTINAGGNGVLRATTGALGPSNKNNPKEAPFAYLVPEEVGQALNKESRSKEGGVLAYADVVELLFGIQTYSNTNADISSYVMFKPDLEEDDPLKSKQHNFTGEPMLGAFLPLMPQFTNKPFWNVLEQFLNPVINEMYTCLRVNKDGDVVPQLVVRQIPFTTSLFADKNAAGLPADQSGPLNQGQATQIKVTPFLSLPRWKMSPVLLQSLRAGRSDATRINFVHVYGQNGYNAGIPIIRQLVVNPPVRDDLDIQRSGLRPFITTVACDAVNQVGKTPGVWMQLVADRLIGSQFTLNGTMSCIGLSVPICEGDNLEFDGVVYHIEGVTHQCSIDSNGVRSFYTTLSLSNGMRIEPEIKSSIVATNTEGSIYPGVSSEDLGGFDPGTTEDRTNPEPEENGGLGSSTRLHKKSDEE